MLPENPPEHQKLVPATQLTVNYSQSHSNLKLNYRHHHRHKDRDRKHLLSCYLPMYKFIQSFCFLSKDINFLCCEAIQFLTPITHFLEKYEGRHLITHLLFIFVLTNIKSLNHAIIEIAEILTLWLVVVVAVTQNELSQSEYQNYGKSRHSIPPHYQSDNMIWSDNINYSMIIT